MTQELELRPQLQWFSQQMERVLRENDHKGGWCNERTEDLMDALCDEVGELNFAACPPKGESDSAQVICEAADVAAFAMMIADNAYVCAEVERDEKQYRV